MALPDFPFEPVTAPIGVLFYAAAFPYALSVELFFCLHISWVLDRSFHAGPDPY